MGEYLTTCSGRFLSAPTRIIRPASIDQALLRFLRLSIRYYHALRNNNAPCNNKALKHCLAVPADGIYQLSCWLFFCGIFPALQNALYKTVHNGKFPAPSSKNIVCDSVTSIIHTVSLLSRLPAVLTYLNLIKPYAITSAMRNTADAVVYFPWLSAALMAADNNKNSDTTCGSLTAPQGTIIAKWAGENRPLPQAPVTAQTPVIGSAYF